MKQECSQCGSEVKEKLVCVCTTCGAVYCEICRPTEQVCVECAPRTIEPLSRTSKVEVF